MNQQNASEMTSPARAMELFQARVTEIAQQSQALVSEFARRNLEQLSAPVKQKADPLNIWQPFMRFYTQMAQQPGKMVQHQQAFLTDFTRLWWSTTNRMMGRQSDAVIRPGKGDKRFRGAAWTDQVLFDFIKQSYLLTSRWLMDLTAEVDGLNTHERAQVHFFTRQFVSAMSPTNFVLTNPEVLKQTIESRGENLLKGLEHMLNDLDLKTGQLRTKMTDDTAFEVGVNVATTPGKVVFETEMMQLIQYDPLTEEVGRRPLLICPPWINKFYILDLQKKNSFIRWANEQGHTVFVISWVNPDERHRDKHFENYMTEGLLEAMYAVERATGEPDLNLIGYCIGGTLSASTLSYLKSKGDDRVKSVTFLTTLTDFEQAGELSVFIDGPQLDNIDRRMAKKGYLDSKDMALTFNMLRENDLIWSFVIDQYLMGNEPIPFDLLYWNGDSTRMPECMHRFYLRNMYLENKLVEPGGITLDGVPIDLTDVDIPVYILSTKEDHIAPWRNTYRATQLYQGDTTFVLSGSGHIAGVVNPPNKVKYGYRTNPDLPESPEAWFAEAETHEGSWWPHWGQWIEAQKDGEVKARVPGDGQLEVIEEAPGRYVKSKAG